MSKQILVAKEKHGTYYYDASTPEALAKSALAILTERDEQGFWYYLPESYDSDKDHTVKTYLGDKWPGWDVDEQTRTDVINAHTAEIKEKYGDDAEILALKSKNWNAAVKEYKRHCEYRKWYDEMRQTVDNKDITSVVTFKSGRTEPRSWWLLSQRSDCEYERVTLEDLQEV